MNIKIKKRKLSKKNGEVIGNSLPLLGGLFVFFVVFLLFLYGETSVNNNSQVDWVARNYMLKMESNGYLTQNDEDDLTKKLENLGLKNIDLNGTTTSPVENGGDIYLNIKAKTVVKKLSTSGNFSAKFLDNDNDVNIKLSSTAKN